MGVMNLRVGVSLDVNPLGLVPPGARTGTYRHRFTGPPSGGCGTSEGSIVVPRSPVGRSDDRSPALSQNALHWST